MHEVIIERWNSRVKDGDRVYHLGDVCMNLKWAQQIMPKLNGTKRLIVGNHDPIQALCQAGLFKKVYMMKWFPEIDCVLSHLPLDTRSFRWRCKANLHGHVHNPAAEDDPYHWGPYHLNVNVELNNYYPWSMDEVVSWVETVDDVDKGARPL